MRNKKRFLAFWLLFMGLTGCGAENEETVPTETVEETVIPVIFRVDPTTNIGDNEKFIKEFNTAHEGTYRIEVEWLSESTSGYRGQLKQWNVLDEMPVLITDAGFDNDFYNLLVADERLVDLRPYMEASEFWMDAMRKDILEDCTEDDGSIYLSPLGSSMETYAGIIYNKELLSAAGYESIPQTWEEFFECLETLKQQGITPLALHHAGSYWVPMLFGTAYLQQTKEGKEFLKTEFPISFQNEAMEEMLEMLQRLYQYTFSDVEELDYEQAASRFMNGEAAIIANGYWMFSVFSEEQKEWFCFTEFPGGVLMNSPRMGAWAVTEGYSDEVTEAAIKALEYRIWCEQESIKTLMEESADPLEQSYVKAVQEAEIVMPNYQTKWEQKLQDEFFTEYMPIYLRGEMETEEFLEKIDEEVKNITAGK